MPEIFICILLLTVTIETTYGQLQTDLQKADSLYGVRNWKAAKHIYEKKLGEDSLNSILWNRLGYCNQNLGSYQDALKDYSKALDCNPSVPVKNSALFRLAMVYSLMNNSSESGKWLIQATAAGFNSLNGLDSFPEFSNLRASDNFKEIRQKVYETVYPCSKEPRNRDFDFWIGDWNCYRTGTQILSGSSHVEVMAGGCALLENYISLQAYTGKSFNFYDSISGKWEQDWIGSGGQGDRQRYYNGEFKNGTMHFNYETINPAGEKQKGNFIFYYLSRDSVRQYQDVMDNTGKMISVTYDLMYLRKNK